MTKNQNNIFIKLLKEHTNIAQQSYENVSEVFNYKRIIYGFK